MGNTKSLGDWGEAQAARYLQGKGFRLLERNYRCPYGEIDLIAEDGTYLVFAEVKLRTSVRYGTPEEAVTPRKQTRLRQTALQYLSDHETVLQPRFDVIAIYAHHGKETTPLPITHIENAF